MNDSTTVQLRVGEVRSVKLSPSIVTFRNAREATTDQTASRTGRDGWMGADR